MWPNLNINFPTEKNVQERILCGAGKGGGGGMGAAARPGSELRNLAERD